MASKSDKHSFEGRFWLPEDRHRGYGRVEYEPREGLSIHLVDTNFVAHYGEIPPRIETLHGETLAGRPVTLFDVLVGHWTQHGGSQGGDVVDGLVGRMVKGAHIDAIDQVPLKLATTGYRGLKELLTGGVVDGGPLWPGAEDRADTLSVALPGDVELLLVASKRRSFQRGNETTEVVCHAQWTFPEATTFDRAEESYFSVLRDLIAFATRRTSARTSLRVWEDDPVRGVDIVERPYPRLPSDPVPDLYALALNVSDVGDPAETLRAWWSLRRRIGPVWNVFFAGLHRNPALLEDQLLGLLAFIEGYHRAIHDEPPLKPAHARRVLKAVKKALEGDADGRELVTTALAHFNTLSQRERLFFFIDRTTEILEGWWEVDRAELASRLIHTRNWLVHWGKRQSSVVDDAAGMVELVRGLILIVYVNLLMDMGLPPESVVKVIGSGWRLEGPPEPVIAWRDDVDGG